jgi:RimJ/RimL family protein N-acetyltransferase
MEALRLPRLLRTERLVVRGWRASDAPLLKEAVDASLEHLQEWLPWALTEPSPLEVVAARLTAFAAAFDEGRDWLYGIFSPDETMVFGGTGLHPRIGPGALEIGYWLLADAVGKGYTTEAVRALTAAAFSADPVERLEIRCDSRNVRSAAVPRRLGYRHVDTLERHTPSAAGGPAATLVWWLTREDFLRGGAEMRTTAL